MHKYVIERAISGIGNQTPEELRQGAHVSNDALTRLGPGIQWIQSFVTADKLFCVYLADDEDKIREHARLSGFPADAINRVRSTIDPTTDRQ